MSLKTSKAYKYAQDVVKGRIKAGKLVILACAKFLKDIKRQSEADFPYYYDEKEAERVEAFAGFMRFTSGANAGKTIELAPFQAFIACNLFAWKNKETHLRRYRKAYIQVARKNGKSFLIALLALYSMLTEARGEVYSVATKRDQAKISYNEASALIRSSPQLRRRFNVKLHETIDKVSESKFAPLSSDSKTLDGTNPSFAIVDEFGAMPDYRIYDVMISGMGARLQPLIVAITTAYFDLGTSPAYKERNYLVDVLEGRIDNEEYFAMIYELDEGDAWDDMDNYIKCNPLAMTLPGGRKFLESELEVAKHSPDKFKNFQVKNLNKWLEQSEESFIDYDKWLACRSSKVLDLSGKDVWVGVDLSKTTDLTAVAIMWREEDKFYLKTHAFLPYNRMVEKERIDKIPYSSYVQLGYCTATPGDIVDYAKVEDYILGITPKMGCQIKELDMDFYNALHLASSLSSKGFEVVEIRQGYKTLSPAVKRFREEVYTGNIVYEHNPILDFCVASAVTKSDLNDNEMLDKKKSNQRIDLLAASMNAFVRCSEDTGPSVYETDGIFVF